MPGWLVWSFVLLVAYVVMDRLMIRYIKNWDRNMMDHSHDHRGPRLTHS